ncbi:MAG: hypothetical protein KDA57_13510, partial [Planctomycetales bacterium]|nr:hypothetical protein [Planctomycetales bacterium]
IELAGTSQGSEYDWVTAQGSAVLSGALEVSMLSGFAPMPGDTFEILTAGSLLGSFDSITLPSLPSELLWFVNQTATSLELVSTYAADFDEDGDVDDDDLTAWDGGFGSGAATHMTGDANFSATANGFDFLAWQRQRGYGGSLSGTAASIPEPSTAILLLACISEAIFHTRRPSLCPIVEQRP